MPGVLQSAVSVFLCDSQCLSLDGGCISLQPGVCGSHFCRCHLPDSSVTRCRSSSHPCGITGICGLVTSVKKTSPGLIIVCAQLFPWVPSCATPAVSWGSSLTLPSEWLTSSAYGTYYHQPYSEEAGLQETLAVTLIKLAWGKTWRKAWCMFKRRFEDVFALNCIFGAVTTICSFFLTGSTTALTWLCWPHLLFCVEASRSHGGEILGKNRSWCRQVEQALKGRVIVAAPMLGRVIGPLCFGEGQYRGKHPRDVSFWLDEGTSVSKCLILDQLGEELGPLEDGKSLV